MSSDHIPVIIEVDTSPKSKPIYEEMLYTNFLKANWEGFMEHIEAML